MFELRILGSNEIDPLSCPCLGSASSPGKLGARNLLDVFFVGGVFFVQQDLGCYTLTRQQN